MKNSIIENLDVDKFIKGSDNGNIKKVGKSPARVISIPLNPEQKELISFVHQALGGFEFMVLYEAVEYVKANPIPQEYFLKHLNFFYNKGNSKVKNFNKFANLHGDLKYFSKLYKDAGYSIGIKGFAILSVLYFADKKLGLDISHFSKGREEWYGVI